MDPNIRLRAEGKFKPFYCAGLQFDVVCDAMRFDMRIKHKRSGFYQVPLLE